MHSSNGEIDSQNKRETKRGYENWNAFAAPIGYTASEHQAHLNKNKKSRHGRSPLQSFVYSQMEDEGRGERKDV